ncbi:MAG: hypothetical protein FWG21_00970 [Oscillospiraceae bacterium]|nr:hypothetical protein [Oscillospiraceae bacterium]
MKKWEADVEEFLTLVTDDQREIFAHIIDYLKELNYVAQKKRTQGFILSFNNPIHNRVIARFGLRKNSDTGFFGLRYSSTTDYSLKFADVIRERVLSGNKPARCGECRYCKGEKFTYTYTSEDGRTAVACGAYVLEIPNITLDDLPEVKCLISQQHEYFMTYAIYEPKG